MCSQCLAQAKKSLNRAKIDNDGYLVMGDPKHWPPDWIAELIEFPAIGIPPTVNPHMDDEVDETNVLAARLLAESPELDPDDDDHDYIDAPVYSPMPDDDDDEDQPSWGLKLAEAQAETPTAPAVAPSPSQAIATRTRRPPERQTAPPAGPPPPWFTPGHSPAQELREAQERRDVLASQVTELEYEIQGSPPVPPKRSRLRRAWRWLTGRR